MQISWMWVRVKGRSSNGFRVPRTPELRPVWSLRPGVKIGPSVDSPGLPASRNPHGFGHSECGPRWSCDALQPRHPCRMRPRRLVGFWPTRSERCLRHRELEGHVTPKRVLHSNFGCCRRTIQKSASYEISGALQRRAISRPSMTPGGSP